MFWTQIPMSPFVLCDCRRVSWSPWPSASASEEWQFRLVHHGVVTEPRMAYFHRPPNGPRHTLGARGRSAVMAMTTLMTMGTEGSSCKHSINTFHRTIGNFSSEAVSQGPEGYESPLRFVPVSSFLRIHRNRNVLSDQLGLPSGPHIFLARPEGQHCYSPLQAKPQV